MKKLIFGTMIMIFVSCGTSNFVSNDGTTKAKDNMVGSDTDAHGCRASAGYVWSEVRQDCVRTWEVGTKMTSVTDKTLAGYAVFSSDSLKVELFLPETDSSVILDRRTLQSGEFTWNTDDDDTFNLHRGHGIWQITRRGKLAYIESDNAK